MNSSKEQKMTKFSLSLIFILLFSVFVNAEIITDFVNINSLESVNNFKLKYSAKPYDGAQNTISTTKELESYGSEFIYTLIPLGNTWEFYLLTTNVSLNTKIRLTILINENKTWKAILIIDTLKDNFLGDELNNVYPTIKFIKKYPNQSLGMVNDFYVSFYNLKESGLRIDLMQKK